MENQTPKKVITRQVSPEWDRLMRIVAKADHGELKLHFKNGNAKRVENLVQSIMLDSDEEYKKGLDTILL